MEHILSLSYGKDSLACLGAIEELGWPLDRIIHAEVWATDTIPADLPPMVDFKQKADAIIKERWGIEVEHVSSGISFEEGFYFKRGRTGRKTKFSGVAYGWPMRKGQWCLQQLKLPALNKVGSEAIQYIGIAVDEPRRFHNLSGTKKAPWLRANGQRQCVGIGARRTTCFPPYTLQPREEAVGSVIIRELISFVSCARIIQNIGSLC